MEIMLRYMSCYDGTGRLVSEATRKNECGARKYATRMFRHYGDAATVEEMRYFEDYSTETVNWRYCPKCKTAFLGEPALSRKDNQTEICSDCGQNEAIDEFMSLVFGDRWHTDEQ